MVCCMIAHRSSPSPIVLPWHVMSVHPPGIKHLCIVAEGRLCHVVVVSVEVMMRIKHWQSILHHVGDETSWNLLGNISLRNVPPSCCHFSVNRLLLCLFNAVSHG